MAKKQVLVSGCSSQIGELICRIICESENFEMLYGFDEVLKEPSTFPVFDDMDYLMDRDIAPDIPDIIIECSYLKNTVDILTYAHINSIPIIILANNFSQRDSRMFSFASKHVPIFIMNNLSFGSDDATASILHAIDFLVNKQNGMYYKEQLLS